MDRLGFLKIMAGVAASPLLAWLPVRMTAQACPPLLFRGTPEGLILASRNAGRDWQSHTDLGKDHVIQGFSYGDGRVEAHILHQGRPFPLRLGLDGRHWLAL